MKKIILFIVVFVAIVVGGFFILNSYIYHQKQADNAVVESDQGTLKKYLNEEFGYSFLYPSDYVVLTDIGQTGEVVVFTEHVTKKPSGLGNVVGVVDQTIEEILAQEKANDFGFEIVDDQNIEVGGFPARRIEVLRAESVIPEDVVVLISHNDKTYYLRQGFGRIEVFNNLVGSFSFVE